MKNLIHKTKENKILIYYALLILYGLLMVFIIWRRGSLFMSTTDYPAQHFAIADYFRKLFLQNKDLFPDFAAAIGGGQNIYNLSYYGLLRPDVLISYLLPDIPMQYILTSYSILLYLAGGCLVFQWIKNHGIHQEICFLMGLTFLSSSVLFQSHRQIMFVNYMPFLILCLWGVDKYLKDKKTALLVVATFLMILHSYYFSVSGIIVCSVYYLYRMYNIIKNSDKSFRYYLFGKNAFYRMFFWILSAVMVSGIFLIPTAAAMLENMRGGNNNSLMHIMDFNIQCNTLIYDYYGCGFSFFIWFTLCLGMTMKKTRKPSCFCLLSLLLPVVPYFLNGTLYIHRKVYLTFIPLILYLCAKILTLKLQGTKSDEKHYFLAVLIPFIPILGGMTTTWLLADAMVTVIVFYFARKKKRILYLMVLAGSISSIYLNSLEDYITTDTFRSYYCDETNDLTINNDNYRFASMSGGFFKSNYVANPKLLQNCIYSSIQNKNYENFMENTMHLSTTSRNNMVHTNSPNIFFHMFMGTRIIHTKNTAPTGYLQYTAKAENIYINNDVLPIAYATDHLLSYQDFCSLDYPYTLDTINNVCVVDSASEASSYKSKIKKQSLAKMVSSYDDCEGITIDTKAAKLTVNQKKKGLFNIRLHNDSDIVILRGTVHPDKPKNDVYITVNGTKEKLSGSTAPYYNHNTEFEYVISQNTPVTELLLECSAGQYSLYDIEIYTCNYEDINNYHNQITPLNTEKCQGKEILKGSISTKNAGYFVTSIPYQKGLTATVDGKKATIENINCGFAGLKLTSGNHRIVLSFHAPGKKLGLICTILGLFLWCMKFMHTSYLFLNKKRI